MSRPLLILTILMTAIAVYTPCAIADPQKTTRKIPRKAIVSQTSEIRYDTVAANNGMVYLSGYDKPLRSRTESMFVTNHMSQTLYGVIMTVSYSDMKGRELHKRTVKLACDIPPSSTRLVTFPSWDKQTAFYYRLSQKPRRADGTPYDATCECDSVVIIKPETSTYPHTTSNGPTD